MSDLDVANQINDASASSAPAMPTPNSTTIELLRGLQDPSTEEWHTLATVRELTGNDEESLAQLGAKDSMAFIEYMTSILDMAVESIGDLKSTKDLLNKLVLPDRDMLFLAIVQATYGNEKEVVVTCRACGEEQHIMLELSEDFPIEGRDLDLRTPISVKLRGGISSFRIPNGDDVAYASKKSKSTPEVNTLLIGQCVITNDNLPLKVRIDWARDLGVSDRKKVEKALTKATQGVGPQLGEVDTRCAKCEAELPLSMDWVSLLLG